MHKGNSKYFPVLFEGKRVALTEDEWTRIRSTEKTSGELRKIKETIGRAEYTARTVVEGITLHGKRPFTFERFIIEYNAGGKSSSFFKLFDSYLDSLLAEDRIGTYNSYKNARSAMWDFLGKEVQVEDITPALLKKFDHYLINQREISRNSVAIYMRSVKVIFNLAVTATPSLLEFYPFARKRNDKQRYQIRTESGRKGDAMTLQQVQMFLNTTPPPNSPEWEAKQLWLFSFYCQGMNFKDIAHLKKSGISDGKIVYVRHKTKNTELHQVPFVIPITTSVGNILSLLQTSDEGNPYVFDILTIGLSPLKQEAVAKQKLKITNKYLKRLCRQNNLPEITTYWARHSYASLLKNTGTSTEMIRELLGHSDVRTTESYLKRFDIATVHAINTGIENLVNSKAA
jgi:site-specific recombinase XerD